MPISVPQLQKMAANLESFSWLTKLTKTTIDDQLVAMLQRIAEDEQALEMVCRFINWSGLFGATEDESGNPEPELRPDLEPYRDLLVDMRCTYHDMQTP